MLKLTIRDEAGQTMAEYGVVLALVTLAVLGGLTLLAGNVGGAFSAVAGLLP
jgi:Flp pilus assembly pilin Flp